MLSIKCLCFDRNLQEDVEAVDVEDHYDYNNYRNMLVLKCFVIIDCDLFRAQEEDKIYDHFVVRQDSKREWKNEVNWFSYLVYLIGFL